MKTRLWFVAVLSVSVALAFQDLTAQQTQAGYSDAQGHSARTRAIDEADSRAEQEAERLVSLPPEKIILLLQQEPGLFLEVKKLLVRKAFAQGRILDPKELTDNAIFRMVRDDEETRSLITQQIVDRGYVRAKPSREELAREFDEQQRIQNANARRDDRSYSEPYESENQES